MTTVLAPPAEDEALYPPKVEPPPRPLPLRRFLLTFVRNPLSSLPRPVYEEPIVVHDNGHNVIAWVTDPALVEQVLLHGGAHFPKTPLEKRVFAHTLGEGVLTSEGASWRWQRRTAAPLFRPADLSGSGADHDGGGRGPGGALARAARPERVQAIDRDMTETTFHVISATMFAGSADAEAAAILKSADTALATISWDIAAAMLRLPDVDVVSGQVQAPPGGADFAGCRGGDPGAPACGRPGGQRPAGAPGARAGPRDRRADVGKAAHRQSRDLPCRRARDHRQGADLDALSPRPRAAVAGAHPRRDRRGRRRRTADRRRAPRAAARHARGAEGGDAPLPAGARS